MARERHKPEGIVAKLRQVDVVTSQGMAIEDAIRSIGVREVTYYRWRNEYGDLKSDQMKRLTRRWLNSRHPKPLEVPCAHSRRRQRGGSEESSMSAAA
jgi:transposase